VFLEHLGRRPAAKVLDRINREGHFEIGNVYWRRKRRKKHRTPKAKTTRIAPTKPPRVKTVNVCGHPEQQHYAFGLCVACYRISPEGRAVRRRYETSQKGRYAATPKNRAYQAALSGRPLCSEPAAHSRSQHFADTRIGPIR
jgi:hypothetical protein